MLMKFQYVIAPNDHTSDTVLEPYNNILHLGKTLENSDCCFMFDNETLGEICCHYLGIQNPSYESYNRLIAQVM